MGNDSRESLNLREFFEGNTEQFEQLLLTEAVTVKNKIDEILRVGNIDLVNNAHQLVVYIIEGKDQELQAFAKKEGIAWATNFIDLTFKLEWIQAIRRSVWKLIHRYSEANKELKVERLFNLEKEVNNRVDDFLNAFFISYSTYKDALINEQRKIVKGLSVPIIPINERIAILPLIGSIDSSRISILEEKTFNQVGNLGVELLIIDLSGVADMESEEIRHLTKIIDGIFMMGCKTTITGLRKEVARKVTSLGISFGDKTKTLGTLQQALNRYLVTI